MAPRAQRGKAIAHVGNNRGGFAVVDMVPATTANGITTWECVDPKPGRAVDLARHVSERFPGIQTVAREVDGQDAQHRLADDAVIIGTVDSVGATRDLIASRRSGQSFIFQLLGRGPGPAMAAARLGIGGAITDAGAQIEAQLLFDGLAQISADASSRALTGGGAPITAASLEPMRRSAARWSVQSLTELVEGRTMDSALSLFTSGRFPLLVRPMSVNRFSVEKAQALDALETFELRSDGAITAVALVAIEARLIDIIFVRRSRTDRRYADRVLPLRAQRGHDATFTD